MTNVTTVLTFGTFNANDGVNTILMGMRLGTPTRTGDELVTPNAYEPAVANVRTNLPTDSLFRIRLHAASVDALASLLSQLEAELSAGSLITVGIQGSAYTATITPLYASCVEVPMETAEDSAALVHAFRTVVDVSVRRKPYLLTSTETLHAASSFALPAVVSMAGQSGQFAAPWDLLFDFAALEVVALYAGRCANEAAVIGDFARELVTAGAVAGVKGAWVDVSSVGAPASDNAGYGTPVSGNEVWGTEGVCYTDLIFTDLEPSEYHLLVNAKSADVSDPGTIHHPYCDPVVISGTTLHLYSLGTVILPPSATRGSVESTLRLTLTGKGAGDAVYANALFAIPVSSGGMIVWRRTSGHAHQLRWEDGLVYADDAAALGEALSGQQILGKGGALVAIAEQATPAPSTVCALTAALDPRWEQLPSDPPVYAAEEVLPNTDSGTVSYA